MTDFFIPKHRPGPGRIRHDIVVDRFWRHKVSKVRVEVIKHMLVDGVRQQIVFFDPERQTTFSLSLAEMKDQYEPDGNFGAGLGGRPSFHKKYPPHNGGAKGKRT